MASAPRGLAAYKKKDGVLAMAKDGKTITWTPASGDAAGMVTIAVAHITSAFSLFFSFLATFMDFMVWCLQVEIYTSGYIQNES